MVRLAALGAALGGVAASAPDCPASPTFTAGAIGKGLSQDCELSLPQYGAGDCPGPSCQSYQDYWSAEAVIKEHYPRCPKARWPAVWQPAQPVALRHGCTVEGWQQTRDGRLCPDPNRAPLPCPGLNISSADNVSIKMATCHQSGSAATGAWGGFDAVADYLGSAAVVDAVACADSPAVAGAVARFVCPVWTPAMSKQAAAYPQNLPTLSAIKRICGTPALKSDEEFVPTAKPSPPSFAAQKTVSLDGDWQLSSDAGHKLTGSVPGDLITDLENGRIVRDPLYELSWLNNNTEAAPPWTAHVWTYSTHFTAPPASTLVLDGIKMCARILINGKEALTATDQFLRYTIPLDEGEVKLEVVFDPKKDEGGRYMASSGGWDFVP